MTSITVSEFIERLQHFPAEWHIRPTKAGGSVEVWEPGGHKYAYVFTDARPARELTSRGTPFLTKEEEEEQQRRWEQYEKEQLQRYRERFAEQENV